MTVAPEICQWLALRQALTTFATWDGGTQSARHIRPLHWYVACRLVWEGGFPPESITPRPPFAVETGGGCAILKHDPACGGAGERTVLGGLKTKDVDVVVTMNGIGPVLAVSMKGTLNAFRNLTNRMEEAVGDCTNLHISYPALVYGFFHVLKGTREGPGVATDDVALSAQGEVLDSLTRYHDVLKRLTGRDDIRNEVSKYEAVALALISPQPASVGQVVAGFPPAQSPLHMSGFFANLYRQYDLRFVYAAPGLAAKTRRLQWAADSPALLDVRAADPAEMESGLAGPGGTAGRRKGKQQP